ncbi:MAG TPA: hypothetical protein DCY56_08290 [Candidatus Omnitrophica bacterium]|nr:hypothetical protein [Candidatus Omnitrophota bacterium]
MAKIEIAILRDTIKDLIKSNKSIWNELKREIFDYGYQEWYCSEGDFKNPTIKAVFSLSREAKEKLINEWKRIPRLIERKTEDEILKLYSLIVVERIVDRARVA